MIDKNSPIPVYYQLKNDFIKKIASGVWKAGECISSERELCEIYDVSRMTIRQAIGELVQEGVLTRKKGKGTFVCEQKVNQKDMMSFTEMIKQSGRSLETKVVEFEIIDTPEDIQDVFILDRLYKISRKRIVDNECIAVETVYIPVDYCGHLNKEMLEGSLYKVLEGFGYIITNSNSSIVAVNVDDEIRKILECEIDTPILKVVSKTFTNTDKLLFLEEAFYKSDKFTLQVNISRKEGEVL
ncbi:MULTISPECIES: GntR family transcriptional regulator [unclassified Clostridium]|uniref:GntR family transcriptional regulator n=1 Tax=Clostridium TaxID=1485 RepID=UPI001C8BA79B|nr:MULTISPECIES: GntR family transcriptional regulator [unclassified Clostridium]MBX9136986.1 GntR family transcriptional regulator [Clostridium sp. K12(2020)]MBX9143925.1 GntR family transcriptional regulator [Clostridium sp. K13]MDU2290947.1 GntR family transcriptional regulator [Clostridium celatum]